jgi:hypothetical protein
MTHQSEDRLPESLGAQSVPSGARIIPFERPQSELQRAIQQRAQETLDRNRERDRETRRPQPLKLVTILALACIPVLLTLVAVDGFLRVFHQVTEIYSAEPAQPQGAPAEVQSEPQTSSTPGVVILQSYEAPAAAPRSASPQDAGAPSANPQR